MEEALEDLLSEKPCKVIKSTAEVRVACQLRLLDFEGRADGRSIKTILSHVAPLKLILVHGTSAATEGLRQHCLQSGICKLVHAPRVGETVDVTSDLASFKVKLTEDLMHVVNFKKLGEYEVAWVDGQVASPGGGGDGAVHLEPRPPGDDVATHQTVLVGDLKLSDFRAVLRGHDVEAEFAGASGQLKCGTTVSLRKMGGHKVELAGALTEDYYKVRDLLYSQFYVL